MDWTTPWRNLSTWLFAISDNGLSVVEDAIVTVQGTVAEGQKGQPYFWFKATESDVKMLAETESYLCDAASIF